MKRLLLLLLLSSPAFAIDRPIPCTGNSCKLLFETTSGTGAKVSAGQVAGTGAWTLGPSGYLGHGATGFNAIRGTTRLGANMFIGASGGDYDSIGFNFTTTANSQSMNRAVGDASSRLEFVSGGMRFHTAPIDFAGTPITFTQAGDVTQAGAWTLGPSTFAGQHTAYRSLNVIGTDAYSLTGGIGLTQTRSPSDPTIFTSIQTVGNGGNILTRNGSSFGTMDFRITNGTTNTSVGRYSSTGAWTLGVSGTSETHVVRGVLSLEGASGSSNLRLEGPTSHPEQGMLHIRPGIGNPGYITWTESTVADRWALGTPAGSTDLQVRELQVTGTLRARMVNGTNGWQLPSDSRLKENIVVIENPLSKIAGIRGVTFKNIDGGPQAGVIAQEVYAAFKISTHGSPESDEMMSVDPGGLIGLLIESVKAQQATIESLKTRIAALESQP